MEERTGNINNARLRDVRRRLFQDDDDNFDEQQKCKNIDNYFSEEMRIQLEQSTKKWNFDFVQGKPLPGRFEWVKLDEHGNEISEFEETNGTVSTRERFVEEAENNSFTSIDERAKATKK